MDKIKLPERATWQDLLKRPTLTYEDLEASARQIFKEVERTGDKAVQKYTQLFDGTRVEATAVSASEIRESAKLVSEELKKAIQTAKANIEKFHTAQKSPQRVVETSPGVRCWMEKRPIQKVGLYIPGGSAPLFSTLLMLAVPASIAGCKEIVVCTPPNAQGKIHPAILFAANLCGVTQIHKVGGMQAIAALTFGTASIPAVYKIFGPGNQFVTVAKQLATQYGVAIDMPAGPSELLVFADELANPRFVASDLLSQAEHGPDSQVILVTTSESLLDQVAVEIDIQLATLPRKSIAEKAMAHSKMILIDGIETALDMINEYGPEHLIIISEDEPFFIDGVQNAGSIFLGNYTPESAGDYASGTNHTLPTNGYTRQYSGVNLDSFQKSITFQRISKEGLMKLGPTIEVMAMNEGLEAHKNAVSYRLEALNNKTKV
ncbi:MAG: histidinol dehydrogenase [Bacteroidota bacterium]